MKKIIIFLILLFVAPILSFTIYQYQNYTHFPTVADSGFDSDYGDDGWDSDWGDDGWGGNDWGSSGGGSYRDNYSSDYSGEPADLKTVLIALGFCVFITAIIFTIRYTAISLSKRRKRSEIRKKDINDTLKYYYNLTPGDGNNIELIQTAYSNYVEIQKAWMNRDLSPIKHLLTDEMFNMYQMQVDTLVEDNQINVMSNFEFICGGVESITANKNLETVKIILCVRCKDYIKMANKNKVINGDKHATMTYVYELTFVRDINSNKNTSCPTCGAKVKNQMSATCPYCNNSLLLTSENITLSNKLILHQFKRK